MMAKDGKYDEPRECEFGCGKEFIDVIELRKHYIEHDVKIRMKMAHEENDKIVADHHRFGAALEVAQISLKYKVEVDEVFDRLRQAMRVIVENRLV